MHCCQREAFCRAYNADLVTVASLEEHDFLVSNLPAGTAVRMLGLWAEETRDWIGRRTI